LRHGIEGDMDFGHGRARTLRDYCIFHRDHANEPSGDKAAWAMDLVRASGFCKDPSAINFTLARRIFRADIFQKANQKRSSTQPANETQSEKQLVSV
jgi:hypothetical protein